MSSTWYYAKVVPRPTDSPFTEATDHIPERDHGFFELWREGEYWGWVRLDSKTGLIEFGEPG